MRDVLLQSLSRFYKDPEQLLGLTRALRKSEVSLRVLDWLVTNYAKKYLVSYPLDDGTLFIMFLDYKCQLKAYGKRLFDPFCRRDRLDDVVDDGAVLGLVHRAAEGDAEAEARNLWRVAEGGVGDEGAGERKLQGELDVFEGALRGVEVERGDRAKDDIAVSTSLVFIGPETAHKRRAFDAGFFAWKRLERRQGLSEGFPFRLLGFRRGEVFAVGKADHHFCPPS